MKCEQYACKANYTYNVLYYSHNTYVRVYTARVNGGVSHRSRTFLGLFFHIKEKMLFIVFISIFLLAI